MIDLPEQPSYQIGNIYVYIISVSMEQFPQLRDSIFETLLEIKGMERNVIGATMYLRFTTNTEDYIPYLQYSVNAVYVRQAGDRNLHGSFSSDVDILQAMIVCN